MSTSVMTLPMGEIPVSTSVMTLSSFPVGSKQSIYGPFDPASPFNGYVGSSTTVVRAWQQDFNDQSLTGRTPEPLQTRLTKFIEAVEEAVELSEAMVAAEENDPIDQQTFVYAMQSLLPAIISLQLPPPLVLPLQSGGIGVEWHTGGMNIELRFRKAYDIFAVLEDAQGRIEAFHGRDPNLDHSRLALNELSSRSGG